MSHRWVTREVEEARREWERVKGGPHTGFCGVGGEGVDLVGCEVCTASDGDPRCQRCGMSVGMPGCLCGDGPLYGPCVTTVAVVAAGVTDQPRHPDEADRPARPNVGHYRFSPQVLARLKQEAGARGVSENWLAERLIAEGLERLIPVAEFRLTRSPDG